MTNITLNIIVYSTASKILGIDTCLQNLDPLIAAEEQAVVASTSGEPKSIHSTIMIAVLEQL
jgi:hypothetical protein